MIAPIRETEPPAQDRPRTSDEVRRLVASIFLDETRDDSRPARSIPGWKAWALVAWATVLTLIYFAAMLDLI
jgi:hypothetical protein